jgi:hypothetical protein
LRILAVAKAGPSRTQTRLLEMVARVTAGIVERRRG